MQRSIKGMLGSLLHQLLRENKATISEILEQDQALHHKESLHDWSKTELQIHLMKVLSNSAHTSCLFIDGLDEVDLSEGQAELIRVLENIRALTNVKLCLSSRPEPMLQESLKMYPKLRLQDLNREDIRQLVEDSFISLEGRLTIDENWKAYLIRMISEKADGVILWTSLVTKSLSRGIVNGDDWEVLTKRVDVLPRDMNQLYSHMWSRLNEDQPLYQTQAAAYFTFILYKVQYQSLYQTMVAAERSMDSRVFRGIQKSS